MEFTIINARLLFIIVLMMCYLCAFITYARPLSSTKRAVLDFNVTHLCYPCSPGTIADSNCTVLENKTIAQCANGYCVVDGLYNCSLCLPGTFQNAPHEQKCVPCPCGTFAHNSGAPWCDLCTRGHFCNDTGLTQPYICPPGFYCPNEGMLGPQPCDPGYTCNGTGLLAPIPCDPGFFCRGGKRAQAPCPAGYYCPDPAASSPTPCPCGTFNPYAESSDSDSCQLCTTGNYCILASTLPVSCTSSCRSTCSYGRCTNC